MSELTKEMYKAYVKARRDAERTKKELDFPKKYEEQKKDLDNRKEKYKEKVEGEYGDLYREKLAEKNRVNREKIKLKLQEVNVPLKEGRLAQAILRESESLSVDEEEKERQAPRRIENHQFFPQMLF